MLSREQNELLTRTDRGTPCGEMMRRYWQPVALSEDVDNQGGAVPVRVMGEDMACLRDEDGLPALLGICSPRTAYPCQERAGMVFAYLGPGDPPLLPDYDFLSWRDDHCLTLKIFQDCNFLQAHEGNMDQVHLSFLHRLSERAAGGTLMNESAKGTSRSAASLLAADVAPRIETELTDFGMRELVLRQTPDGSYLKVENAVLPAFAAVPGATQGKDGYLVNWHVPIDDTSHWKYMTTSGAAVRWTRPPCGKRSWAIASSWPAAGSPGTEPTAICRTGASWQTRSPA